MRTQSLSFRLLTSEGLVLAAFFALVALVLEQGFRESAEEALKERLQVQAYSLLTSAELKDNGELSIAQNLQDPRFMNPGSGLYGFIRQTNKKLVWNSPSAIGLDPPPIPELTPGESAFTMVKHNRYAFHYRVIWQNVAGIEREYLFTVVEDGDFVAQQVKRFTGRLRLWLLVIAVVLILIQFWLLRWSLKPLRRIVRDLEAIEKGKRLRLDHYYATELQGLASNLNAFINSERAHLERYRNTLADLAHSLKTPLAILHGCTQSFQGNQDAVIEQLTYMDKIIEYQLQRAAAKGETKTVGASDVSEIIRKTVASLTKVYLDKGIVFDLDIPEASQVYYEEGDLYEIIGNLLDNASKWCRKTVHVQVVPNPRKNRRNYAVYLLIEDDGPGIPQQKLSEILKRGVRADENIHGHGIGMAVVNDLIELLDGKLEGVPSKRLGGMSWGVYLP